MNDTLRILFQKLAKKISQVFDREGVRVTAHHKGLAAVFTRSASNRISIWFGDDLEGAMMYPVLDDVPNAALKAWLKEYKGVKFIDLIITSRVQVEVSADFEGDWDSQLQMGCTSLSPDISVIASDMQRVEVDE